MSSALAADLPSPTVAPIAPVVPPFNVWEGIEFHAQGEIGALFNTEQPNQGPGGAAYNFGHLYTGNANVPQLNQVLLTVTKPIDTNAKGYAYGFTLQGMYGGDMRYNHFLGIGTFFEGNERRQLNLVQAFGQVHTPWLTPGGVDFKIGLWSSPQGYETLDPSTNPFYSHSFTYNYSVTFNHTGILSTTHVNPTVDVYLGIDTGNQTTFGVPNGDPNGKPAGFVGLGFNNLLDNKLTVLLLSHLGPEQNYVSDPTGAGKDMRYYNDGVFTYKINDSWTSVTELNYVRDDFGYGPGFGGAAEAYSAAQYFSYSFNHDYTFNVRGEVFRDTKNFFVSTPTDNSGIAKTEIGLPLQSPTLSGVPGEGTTYASGTLGVTFKPDVPKPFALFMVRPEIRYDAIVSGRPLFASATSGTTDGKYGQFLFGGDIVLGF
jgi:hypothetical protein